MLGLRSRTEPLPRGAGLAILGVAMVFVGIGIAERAAGGRPVIAGVAGAATALLCAAALLGPPRLLPFSVVLATAATAVLANGDASNVAWFVLAVLAGWCALTAPPAPAVAYWAAATVLLVGEAIFGTPDTGWGAWIAGTSFSLAGAGFGRRQRDLNAALREAQAGLAEQAQTAERSRIARELHDVIAHSLTVSLLHVTSARLAVRDDPASAEQALAEAERLGRASLDEVRHVVGMLRTPDAPSPTQPLPGTADLPALVTQFRDAGAHISAELTGDPEELPGTVRLATFRIVQESLTNAAKHAAGAPTSVHVAVGRDDVRIDVDTAGTPGHGVGLGLIGMRERADALGGTCVAGPGGSGWLVHAVLPRQAPA